MIKHHKKLNELENDDDNIYHSNNESSSFTVFKRNIETNIQTSIKDETKE